MRAFPVTVSTGLQHPGQKALSFSTMFTMNNGHKYEEKYKKKKKKKKI